MARTYSVMEALGTRAPAFDLPIANPQVDNLARETRALSDFDEARYLVVVFMCNHCPYVIHVEDVLIETARAYWEKGVQFVGISANDAVAYPADSFEAMAERAVDKAYPFPYLYDASQEVAKAYGAVCTPDLYIYDPDRKLVYHGRIDETRPRMGMMADGSDLRRALDDLLNTGTVSFEQVPSMGCNIKWKDGS